jgi:hypothetical protein
MNAWEDQLSRRDGMAMWIDEIIGSLGVAGDLVRRNPPLVEDVSTRMLAGQAAIRTSPPIPTGRVLSGIRAVSQGSNMLDWSL